MIRFTLKCPAGHRFDSWFSAGADYERLRAAGHLSCAVCGSAEVEKAPMAPAVAAGDAAPPAPAPGKGAPGPLSAPASPAEQALRELRRRIERSTEDVGRAFAAEARRIHDGEAEARAIRGEARPEEARALIEDGIPVAPLPWRTRRND